MELLVIFDSFNRDPELGGEIEKHMTNKGWKVKNQFSFAFSKTASGSAADIEKTIKTDVDATTVEAEWKNVNYLFVIEGHAPKFDISPGM